MLHQFSGNTQWLGSIIVLVVCIFYYNQRPVYIRVLGLFAMTSIVFQSLQRLSRLFFYNKGLNEIGDTYVFFEGIILPLVFYNAIQSLIYRRCIIAGIFLYVIIYGCAFLFFGEYFYSIIRGARDLLMILLSLSYFVYLMRTLPEEDLLRFPMFWINAAMLIFFSGTFILSYLMDYIILTMRDQFVHFWTFRNFFRFAFCLVLAYAGWLNLKTIRATQSLN